MDKAEAATDYLPLVYTDLTEQTYRVLRDRILSRQLKPGDKISVPDVARGLGVSRTPVTDALKRLAGEGLVRIVPRRGTFVTELTARDVVEFFEIRQLVELYAVECVIRAGEIDRFLQEIEQSMARMRRAMTNGDYGDYEAFMDGDRDLHLRLVSYTRNERLIDIYTSMNVHMQVARAHYLGSVENARQAQAEHDAFVSALRTGDLDRAKEALSKHISNVKARILSLLEARGGRL